MALLHRHSNHLLRPFRHHHKPLTTTTTTADPLYTDLPRPRHDKSERKPYPTPMKLLIQRAKKEKAARMANPCRALDEAPDNGLLVNELVGAAHRVYKAREMVLVGVERLTKVIRVNRCRHCFEVHIGQVGHEIRTCTGPKSSLRHGSHTWRKGGIGDVIFFPKCFHLYDRVGKPRVLHSEKRHVRQIPAIVELCIQAGVDLEKYPTKRRTRPVYSIEGRIVDFEADELAEFHKVNMIQNDEKTDPVSDTEIETPRKQLCSVQLKSEVEGKSLQEVSTMTLNSWFEMISGAKEITKRYRVHTCGYCPEVQVGPKGHKVKMCKASKHQSRDGLHAWQEATIDDLVGPNYVWHVRDLSGPPLNNRLKRYYGKAPAIVELCVQGGAPIPATYRSMMRLDVVLPSFDEFDIVS